MLLPLRQTLLTGFGLVALMTAATAKELLPGDQPVFTPGIYQSESRNSKFPDTGAKTAVCISSASAEDFINDTRKQYESTPHFLKACTLGPTMRVYQGYAFAMDCKGSGQLLTFRFTGDLIISEIATQITRSKKHSSTSVTFLKRVGNCSGLGERGA